MPECIDASIVRPQQPFRQPVLDRALTETEAEQLVSRHLPVLAFGKFRDGLIDLRSRLPPHMGAKCERDPIGPAVVLQDVRGRYVLAVSCGRAIAVRSSALSSVSSSTPFSRATSRIVRFEATASFTISVALS